MEGLDVGFLGPPGAAVGLLRRLPDLLELVVVGGVGELGLAARCASTRTSLLWAAFWSGVDGGSALDIAADDDKECTAQVAVAVAVVVVVGWEKTQNVYEIFALGPSFPFHVRQLNRDDPPKVVI